VFKGQVADVFDFNYSLALGNVLNQIWLAKNSVRFNIPVTSESSSVFIKKDLKPVLRIKYGDVPDFEADKTILGISYGQDNTQSAMKELLYWGVLLVKVSKRYLHLMVLVDEGNKIASPLHYEIIDKIMDFC